jgi:hypothetical protein
MPDALVRQDPHGSLMFVIGRHAADEARVVIGDKARKHGDAEA